MSQKWGRNGACFQCEDSAKSHGVFKRGDMKRKVIVRLAGAGALLIVLGALAVETVNQLYVEP
jgi:hypothetical protein